MRSNEPEAAWAKAEVAWAWSRSGDIHSKAPVGGTAFEQGVTERAPGQAGRSQERRGTGCRNGAWDEAPEETLAHDTHPCPPPRSRRGPAAPRAGPQGSEERGREHGPERPPGSRNVKEGGETRERPQIVSP